MATKTKTPAKAIINIRTDAKTKLEAQKVFKRMGFDLSTGVNMYLYRIAQDKAMPFTPRTVNGFTPEFEARVIRETEYAEKHGKGYKTVEEALKAVS
jgi:addiction module RelB/DinJ family antitoxin